MKWEDAQALIEEIRKTKGRKGQMFLDRIEAMRPDFLLPEDARYLMYLYRYRAGGGRRVFHHKNQNGDE